MVTVNMEKRVAHHNPQFDSSKMKPSEHLPDARLEPRFSYASNDYSIALGYRAYQPIGSTDVRRGLPLTHSLQYMQMSASSELANER